MAKKKKPLSKKSNAGKKAGGRQSADGNWRSFLNEWWQSKAPVLRFSMSFFGLMIIFYAFWFTSFFKNFILAPWNEFNAWAASLVLSIFGFGTKSSGQTLMGEGTVLSIQQGCDALEPTALFIIGVIASPASLRSKFKGIVYGSLFILSINFLRIITLYLTEKYWPAGFEFMHVEFWQVAFILLAIGTWAYWLNRSIKRVEPGET